MTIKGIDTSLGVSATTTLPLALASGFLSDIVLGQQASLRLFANDTTTAAFFGSRNNNIESNRPTLTLTASAVPEPNALLLSMIAVAFGIYNRRRS